MESTPESPLGDHIKAVCALLAPFLFVQACAYVLAQVALAAEAKLGVSKEVALVGTLVGAVCALILAAFVLGSLAILKEKHFD